jgi:multicopper oxidase
MKDRNLRLGAAGLVLAGLLPLVPALGLWQWPSLQTAVSPSASTTPVPPPQGAPAATPIPPLQVQPGDGQLRDFQLAMSKIKWEIAPGKIMDAYAYNGQVPGPELRVTEGDTVRVTVTNQADAPTTVHWHGVDVPTTMDGVPDLSQAPIPPGSSFTYEFVVTPAGTRWYHSHFDEIAQQGAGLYGALIIEPRQRIQPQADREYTIVASQWQTGAIAATGSPPLAVPAPNTGGMSGTSGMSGMGGLGGASTGPTPTSPGAGAIAGMTMFPPGATQPVFDTFTLNGKAAPAIPPLVVREGDRVHLRLINAGATDTLVFGLAGHRLSVTNSDGNPLLTPVDVDGVPLGVGERADVEFVANNPGRWRFLALGNEAGRGADSTLVYEGHEEDSLQDFPSNANLHVASYADFSGPPQLGAANRTMKLELSGGAMMGMGSETDWTINGKNFPNTDSLYVKTGERVRLSILNMSMEDHPMHLHGHTFQVVAVNGRSVDGPLKDTLTVRHMEQYDIEFIANNPGDWLFHCHNLVHMTGGLMMEIHYQ